MGKNGSKRCLCVYFISHRYRTGGGQRLCHHPNPHQLKFLITFPQNNRLIITISSKGRGIISYIHLISSAIGKSDMNKVPEFKESFGYHRSYGHIVIYKPIYVHRESSVCRSSYTPDSVNLDIIHLHAHKKENSIVYLLANRVYLNRIARKRKFQELFGG